MLILHRIKLKFYYFDFIKFICVDKIFDFPRNWNDEAIIIQEWYTCEWHENLDWRKWMLYIMYTCSNKQVYTRLVLNKYQLLI